ncbi:SDR family NAD(P)-dependent oxidoreductase [Aldersonia kunmingensis]|uniref:SDR family NAD(P)-dependent oxidoreductase n=1 Tax=Aldersonia kunmingensis TaxID=408066 RepID=UPI00082B92B0|nr:SDR family oxidoreductase [Aldersonia kunmingensis]
MSDQFTGQVAIVTGAGSGIGAAMCRALVAGGAEVQCTDIDVAAAQRTAQEAVGRGIARAAMLDVTDAAAVQAMVDETVASTGRLDLMVNNAGVCFGGNTELLTIEQWNTIIDINIRGVVHGVAAAYPVMIGQGRGHIVNMASVGGLVTSGQLASYTMTKHAVVGLSLALRSEAAAHGVGVLTVCPGVVETPLLDKGSLGEGWQGREFFLKGQGLKKGYDPDLLAADTLRAIAGNRALLVVPGRAYLAWLTNRVAPALVQRMSTRFVKRQRVLQRR